MLLDRIGSIILHRGALVGPEPVQILHASVPGRARFHVPILRGSEALMRRLETDLGGLSGIWSASANPVTGNILVYFDPAVGSESVADRVGKLLAGYPTPESSNLPLQSRDESANTASAGLFASPSISPSPHPDSPPEPWHQLSAAEVLTALAADPQGLSSDEVPQRLRRYGKNFLPGTEPASTLDTFVDQFGSLPVALLVGGAALTFLTAGAAEAFVILGVVGINAAIGFIFERRAETMIQSLRTLGQPRASVLRDGRVQWIDREQIVPGDILVLKRGTLVPADGRIFEASRLRINEAALTGESMPVSKVTEALHHAETPIAERSNTVYRGTLVSGGSGLAVTVTTGKFTELGRIQGLVHREEKRATPLERMLDRLARHILVASGCVFGLSFVVALLRSYGLLEILRASLSLAVAALPEGLPTITTTTLALGIQNMRRRRVMIHRIEAVEALGSVQVICFDKTGTITMNQVMVTAIHAGMRRFDVSDGRLTADGAAVDPLEYGELLRLMQVGALCSDTDMRREDGGWVLNGPPMDNALLNLALGAGVDVPGLRMEHPVVAVRRGSAHRKYMMSIHRCEPEGADRAGLITVKGRPRAVLERCHWQIREGQKLPLGEEDRRRIEIEIDRLSSHALRTVGVAYTETDSPQNPPEQDPSDLIWLGLVGLSDPIRPGAKELIGAFHEAGIATVMITGDRTATAYNVAKELGLAGRDQIEILDSTQIRKLEPEVLSGLTERVHVFARLSPAEKRQIVLALQRRGKVVAMTGDGINDSPALKSADIGVAMGKSGTLLAREVADVVLEDDRLETMIVAVRQGRTTYDNIRKSTRYLLAATLGETIVRFAGVALNVGPTTPYLWINPIIPSLALALEPPEPDVLKRPPRSPQEAIIGTGDLKRIAFEGATMALGAAGAYGYGLARYGPGARAGTLAFTGLAAAQLLHALNCRSEHRTLFREGRPGEQPRLSPNPYLWLSIGGTLLLHGVALFLPAIRTVLRLTPLSLLDGAVIGAGAVIPLLINDATKGLLPGPAVPPTP
jgi:P-type Ca2+ transporter type 2C